MHLDYHIKTSFMFHVSYLRFKTTVLLQIDCIYGVGSSAIDFTQLEISVFYLVPKRFRCPN